MSTSWKFPSNNKAGREGFNATGIAIFAGGLAQSFVREVIQNSLDARLVMDQPVEVDFSLLSLDKSEVPELTSLEPHLLKAQEAETTVSASTDEGRNFYKRATTTLKGVTKARFLAVHDANTTGLTGPTEDTGATDQQIGGWLGLVKGSGITKKEAADALGSFGQGAKAPFAISSLRTVFYLTKTIFQGQESLRFQGKSILQSMTLGDRDLSQATGYYGDSDELGPLTGAEIPTWAMAERSRFSEQTGTTIFIAEPHLPEEEGDLWFDVTVAVISNFYFAIRQGNLSVTLGNGTRLEKATLAEVFERLDLVHLMSTKTFSDEVRDGMQSVVTIHAAVLEGVNFGVRTSPAFGEYAWFIRVGDEVTGRVVGIARKSGMLITRSAEGLKQFRGVKNFDLFICVTGAEGSEILRSFENPEHNKFQFDRVTDQAKRIAYEKKYKEFRDEVKAFIQEIAGYELLESASTNDLNHILGGVYDLSTGTETDPASRKVRVGRRVKRTAVSGEGVWETTDSGGGRGTAGGDGEHSTTGGSIPDESGEGDLPIKKLIGTRLDSMRLIALDEENAKKTLTKVKAHITGSFTGQGEVRLFIAGETQREPIIFATSDKGEAKAAHLLSFKKGTRARFEWYIPKEAVGFSIEGVVSRVD